MQHRESLPGLFPLAAMPKVAQWLGLALSLTYYLQILRGILLKYADLIQFLPQKLTLAAIAVLLIGLRVRRLVSG